MASITNLDRGLMDHASAEDVAAEASFRQLFTSTYPSLVAYARRRCFDHAEADDVVAEVYATAWRRRNDFQHTDPAADISPLPWLYGIAANVVRNARRAGSRRLQLVERLQAQPTAGPDGGGGLIDGAVVDDSPGAELRQALERLSSDDRELLRLVAWEGLSHSEAGRALDCTANAVGIRLHRARQRLQAELSATEPATALEAVATGPVAPKPTAPAATSTRSTAGRSQQTRSTGTAPEPDPGGRGPDDVNRSARSNSSHTRRGGAPS